MKLETIIERAPGWYDRGLAICLEGAPGIGKTETMCSIPAIIAARKNKRIGLVVLNGGLLNEMDTMGYLIPKHHDTYAESLFTRPFYWTQTQDGQPLESYDGGFIIVDEYDKCMVEVKKILGAAAYSKILGGHQLPPGWVVWFAGNRTEDRSGSTKNLDHLINRVMMLPVTVDLEGWISWANKANVTALSIAFARNNPGVVFSGKVPTQQGPWCSPRSLVALDGYMQLLSGYSGGNGNWPDDAVFFEEACGMIGEAATVQYINTIKLDKEMPKFEKILADPEGVKVPENPSALWLVCFTLAHRVTELTCEKVVKYVERMPKEFGVTFARAACNRNNKLVKVPAMDAWAFRNASLMAAIGK